MTFADPADWSVSVPARLFGENRAESLRVSCNRARRHVLIEGTRKPAKPVLAALTVPDARWLLTALRPSGRSTALPAVGNGLAWRRVVVTPATWYVELAIYGPIEVIGRWHVHADQLPEVGFALAESITLIRAATPQASGRAAERATPRRRRVEPTEAAGESLLVPRRVGVAADETGAVGEAGAEVQSRVPATARSIAVSSAGSVSSARGTGGDAR
ncbi:hypothetical protein FHR81_002731 [Actinoalloteichus hoggarensis]|uniref:Uncharacterized protein n=1 Tax=Actinoalloteichus hoggarensis TaxID=1470176 RepID=A0A221VXV5_9PSEU|nr:hypothetical protein [Actinoalloteichus hoggarensis]ASO18328.1 hypothetical protein AHOG_03350 [Actinoalloteichus hoggarensis]MBB5921691.1 hypothetical protein [Actinoalloteichus hoggarensis]